MTCTRIRLHCIDWITSSSSFMGKEGLNNLLNLWRRIVTMLNVLTVREIRKHRVKHRLECA